MRGRKVADWLVIVTVSILDTANAEDSYWVGTTGDWLLDFQRIFATISFVAKKGE